MTVLPPFLTGSLMPFMRDDVGLDTRRLGLLVAGYFATVGLTSVPGGRLAERFGARRMLLLANALTATSMLAIALVSRTWFHVGLAMIIAGCANGILQPASNLAVMRGVRRRRQGMAFGIKQSAGPTATMVAGLAVPVVAVTIGWRYAFALAAVPVPLIAMVLPREILRVSTRGSYRLPPEATGRLRRIALAAAFAFGAGVTMGSFFVDSVVTAGGSAEFAAIALTVASIACVAVRLAVGWLTDRAAAPSLKGVAGLVGAGTIGFAVLIVAAEPVLWMFGAVIALGAGWGWPGLLHHSVAAAYRESPAAATGVTSVGSAVGAALGPIIFSTVADRVSFAAAWGASMMMAAVAVVFILFADRPRVSGAVG